ncbi:MULTISPECIES: helix-turn-helix transcriptional regulator [Catenuloplanes]|uniref:Transcriptional regulator YheO n=1 Tax=Catenuloplanes niger TaxID=587534 RepID=A0AAE3ZL08_9ACTN|nr:helix-turn-helix transcriptional regulator [Catenuloplanes niger]MDR7320604.1 putative transcriptional regulator YheO [Catenuloplanes niger]
MSDSADAIFAALRPVVAGIAATFGSACEVVLHDYRDEEHSVVAVAGDVTGRRAGDAMSQIGLRVLAAGDEATNEVNYLTRTADGRTLKCSTLPLRDGHGVLIGALCINVDVTVLHRAAAILTDLAGTAAAAAPLGATNFSGDLDQVVSALVEEAEAARGMPVAAMDKHDRLEVVRALHDAGVFALRGAPGRVSTRLGISRAALYNDLAAIRENG